MTNPRAIIAAVAREYVGTRETSRNRGEALTKFWKATRYPSGAVNREPWCSAFVTFCVREGDRRSDGIKLRVPPTFAAVAEWLPWAEEAQTGCLVARSAAARAGNFRPEPGDIVVFLPRLSHIGIVARTYTGSGAVETIEGNTNSEGSREGDGVWKKLRPIDFCGTFIRVPCVAAPKGAA